MMTCAANVVSEDGSTNALYSHQIQRAWFTTPGSALIGKVPLPPRNTHNLLQTVLPHVQVMCETTLQSGSHLAAAANQVHGQDVFHIRSDISCWWGHQLAHKSRTSTGNEIRNATIGCRLQHHHASSIMLSLTTSTFHMCAADMPCASAPLGLVGQRVVAHEGRRASIGSNTGGLSGRSPGPLQAPAQSDLYELPEEARHCRL